MYLEASHLVDAVAVMLLRGPGVAALVLAGAFLQILLIVLEVVHGRRRADGVPRSAGSGTLILL